MSEPQGALVLDRLKRALSVSTLDDLAERLGEKRATVGSWSSRSSVPLPALIKAADIADCSLDWLVRGVEKHRQVKMDLGAYVVEAREEVPPWITRDAAALAPRLQDRDGALLPVATGVAAKPLLLRLPTGPGDDDCKEFEIIPRVVRAASAGPGAPDPIQGVDVIDLAGDMAFSYEWLRHNLGHTSGRVASIKVRGDSMSPTLLDGDTILIDQDVRAVDVDGIYVLDLYGRRLIKRVQQLFDGSLVLISDNAAYQREQLPRDRARDVGVLGRMVWPRVR